MELEINKEEFEKILKKLDMTDEYIYRNVKKMMRKATNYLMQESINRAPIDEGLLVASHASKVDDKKGEIVGHVYIPANSPASKYAIYMHEKEYNLGIHSQEKQLAVKVKVGRKFLERALLENKNFFKYFFTIELRRLL